MTPMKKILTLIPLLALGGCAASSYCEGEQTYQTAPSVPTLQPADGLQVRDSASALKIPPAPENAVAYGEVYRDADGDEAMRCLDKPPDLPPPVEPKPEEKKPA